MRRIDEDIERPIVRLAEPVNKYPEFVRALVRQLKVLCPTMGKVRIAHVLARAGLQLGATTVGRILREPCSAPEETSLAEPLMARSVKASGPGDLWHIDLTAVPTGGGLWVPWLPNSLQLAWPFCWWVLVIVDHASRAVVNLRVFRDQPTAEEVAASVTATIRSGKRPPRTVVTDKGGQFDCDTWKKLCSNWRIRPRFGAIGRHGSIAVVERLIRAMKTECTSRLLVPLDDETMRRELALYAVWYNEHRPHQALDGRTPSEMMLSGHGTHPVSHDSVSEPIRLEVSYLAGRRHLPIVELRLAA